MRRILLSTMLILPAAVAAEEPAKPEVSAAEAPGVTVTPGTKIPLSMINSISTKHAAEGDRVYLETVFPIMVNGRIVIPPGSYVAGTVTSVRRPGKVKGKGELYIRFDSLTLPNGTTRDFRARIGALDGRATEELDKHEGKIISESNKGGDAVRVGQVAAAGASIGAISGGYGNNAGMGAGIGAAAGAAAGLATVLLTRGPDAVLAKGTTLEMVLDRPLTFEEKELDIPGGSRRSGPAIGDGPGPIQKQSKTPMLGGRLPI